MIGYFQNAGPQFSDHQLSPESGQLISKIEFIQHSRWITPERSKQIWSDILEPHYYLEEIPAAFWLEIRRSTFPLQLFSDDEENALLSFKDTLLAILLTAQVTALVVWLVMRRQSRNGNQTTINIKDSNHIALDKSTVQDGQEPSTGDSQNIEIVFKMPVEGLARPVILTLLPHDQIAAFPMLMNYINVSELPNTAISLLQNGSDDERAKAAHLLSLGDSRNSVKHALIARLSDPSPMVRASIIQVIGEQKIMDAVPRIKTVIKNPKEKVTIRNLAAISLARIGTEEAIDFLLELICDGCELEDLTWKIIIELDYQKILGRIITRFSFEDENLYFRFLRILLLKPECTLEVMNTVLTSETVSKERTLKVLEKLIENKIKIEDRSQIDLLLAHLGRFIQSEDFGIRHKSVKLLGHMNDTHCLPFLSVALSHEDVNTRAYAALYMSWYLPNPDALSNLLSLCKRETDKDLTVQLKKMLGTYYPYKRSERFIRSLKKPLSYIFGIVTFIFVVFGYIIYPSYCRCKPSSLPLFYILSLIFFAMGTILIPLWFYMLLPLFDKEFRLRTIFTPLTENRFTWKLK